LFSIFFVGEPVSRAVSYEDADQTPVVGREARIMSHMVSKGIQVFFTRAVRAKKTLTEPQWWDKKPGS
jgi:hypothetical protein